MARSSGGCLTSQIRTWREASAAVEMSVFRKMSRRSRCDPPASSRPPSVESSTLHLPEPDTLHLVSVGCTLSHASLGAVRAPCQTSDRTGWGSPHARTGQQPRVAEQRCSSAHHPARCNSAGFLTACPRAQEGCRQATKRVPTEGTHPLSRAPGPCRVCTSLIVSSGGTDAPPSLYCRVPLSVLMRPGSCPAFVLRRPGSCPGGAARDKREGEARVFLESFVHSGTKAGVLEVRAPLTLVGKLGAVISGEVSPSIPRPAPE